MPAAHRHRLRTPTRRTALRQAASVLRQDQAAILLAEAVAAETLLLLVGAVERLPRRPAAAVTAAVRQHPRPVAVGVERPLQRLAAAEIILPAAVAVLQFLLSMAVAIPRARNLKTILMTVAIHRAGKTQTMARHPTPLVAVAILLAAITVVAIIVAVVTAIIMAMTSPTATAMTAGTNTTASSHATTTTTGARIGDG